MINNPKSKAFTLIEILIATAIFTTLMVIVIATFSWAAGYNNRLKESRRVGQEVRSAMDDVTKNIRLANGNAVFKLTPALASMNIGEITLLNCTGANLSTCVVVRPVNPFRYKNLITNADPSTTVALSNAILLLEKDENKVNFYRQIPTTGANYKFVKTEFVIANWATPIVLSTDLANSISLHSEEQMSMKVWFGGYGPEKSQQTQQPYAEVYLIGETLNYNDLQPAMRSNFHLRTLMESRDYNP